MSKIDHSRGIINTRILGLEAIKSSASSLLSISLFCTTSIIAFLVWRIKKQLQKNQKYLQNFNLYFQLPDRISIGEDIQNNYKHFLIMNKMQFMKKISRIGNSVYENLSKITLEDIKLYFNKFDKEILPSFLFGLIIMSLMMGIILIVFDARTLEDINYPNLMTYLILKKIWCH